MAVKAAKDGLIHHPPSRETIPKILGVIMRTPWRQNLEGCNLNLGYKSTISIRKKKSRILEAQQQIRS
jgi:hypothetical protein